MAWTTPVDQSTGHLLTVTEFNAQIIDNLTYLKGDGGSTVVVNNSASHGASGSPPTNNPGSPTGVFLNSSGVTQVSRATSSANLAFTITQPGADTQFVFGIKSDGSLEWGAGGASTRDTIMQRTAAGILAMTTGKGIGYGTGLGGTVTQATSRSTAVTINTVCGVINTNTTSIANLAYATFTVNNSLVAATDVVIVNLASTPTNQVPCTVQGVSPGSFGITYQNVTGSAQTTSYAINFAIIKAVAS